MDKQKQTTELKASDLRDFGRRNFVMRTALVGAGMVVGPLSWAASSDRAKDPRSDKGPRGGKNKMKTRRLGTLEVSEMGAGCMSISANYGPPADKTRASRSFVTAHERGVTFFDTAEVYGPFTNEELVGEALAPFRDKVVIATKFGFDIEARWAEQPAGTHQEGRRGVTQASEDRPHRSLLPASRRSRRADRRRGRHGQGSDQAGKGPALRSLEASAKTIRRAHAVQPVTAIQTEYSLMERDPEQNGVLKTCEELGIGFVPWGPLGMGYLTGKIDARTKLDPKTDLRAGFERFTPENIAANRPIVDLLNAFAARRTRRLPRWLWHGSGAEALDRFDPRHPQHGSSAREPRGAGCPKLDATRFSSQLETEFSTLKGTWRTNE